MKKCCRCKVSKHVGEFNRDKNRKDGRYPACKICQRKANAESAKRVQARNPEVYAERRRSYVRRYKARHPERARQHNRKQLLRRKFGMELEDYERMFKAQQGRCAICRIPEKRDAHLSIDHDHKTGKIRGLLCSLCNPALGGFQDSTRFLRAAIKYLQESK